MAVSKRVRYEVLRRDGHACRYCGGTAPDVALTVDHVVPVALGGSDDSSNLVAACRDCNAGKASTVPGAETVEDIGVDAERWAAAMCEVAAVRRREIADRAELWGWFNMHWCELRDPHTGEVFDAAPDWIDQVAKFLEAGLQSEELVRLIRIAQLSRASDKWRYFCGCCHNRLRENADLAARIIAVSEGGNGA